MNPLRLLVNGTCLSRGPGSWPYFLESQLQAHMVNLSVAGVGNSYVFESTMRELCRRTYDLVVLTWSTSHHVAVRVDDIEQFRDSKNTSLHQSSVNDWPEKIESPVNDQDYVEKNWIMNVGSMTGIRDSVSRFFDFYHTYVKFPQSLERDLTNIIAMQSFLRCQNTPYLFVYTRPIKRYQRFDYLYRQIDWSAWYLEHSLPTIAQLENGRYSSNDDLWVNTDGHRLYADLLCQHIQNQIIDQQSKASS